MAAVSDDFVADPSEKLGIGDEALALLRCGACARDRRVGGSPRRSAGNPRVPLANTMRNLMLIWVTIICFKMSYVMKRLVRRWQANVKKL